MTVQNKIIMMTPNEPILRAVLLWFAGLANETKRTYGGRIALFIEFLNFHQSIALDVVLALYYLHLEDCGLSELSIANYYRTALKFLEMVAYEINETSDLLGIIKHARDRIPHIRGDKISGTRLTKFERDILLKLPGIDTHKGRRDTIILALLFLCGMRRKEIADLRWCQIVKQNGHPIIKNIKLKNRIRSVKLPNEVWEMIQVWANLAGLDKADNAPVFVRVRRGDHVQHEDDGLNTSSIGYIVRKYGDILHKSISPLDGRKTAARLAKEGGATLDQIRIMLGHASTETTLRYVGDTFSLDDHAIDYQDFDMPSPGPKRPEPSGPSNEDEYKQLDLLGTSDPSDIQADEDDPADE